MTQPPQLAIWLISLFAPLANSEPVAGDLLEESIAIASRSGSSAARRWYWHQTLRTIPHLLALQFRSAPGRIVFAVLAGCGLLNWSLHVSDPLLGIILARIHVYHYINPYLFWLLCFGLVERVLCPLMIGWLVAIIAKRAEMAALIVLDVLYVAVAINFLASIRIIVPHISVIWLFVRWWPALLSPLALLCGAVIRRRKLAA